MNNLERWVYGLSLLDINSYEALKEEVYQHTKRDYVFFPFLIGYAKRYLKENVISEDVRNCVYQLLYDLLNEKKIVVYFVNKTTLKRAHWENINEIIQIIEMIKKHWDELNGKEPEMNEVIWLSSVSD